MSMVLDRRRAFAESSAVSYPLSHAQREADGLIQSFQEQVSDWKNLSAMTAGSIAFRLGKCLSLASPLSRIPYSSQTLAPILGMSAEVSSFRGVHHLFGNSLHDNWFTTYVHFSALKGLGKLAQNQNIVLSHFLQDVGMVSGHHLAYGLRLATKPQGSLGEQFLHAEVSNLALGGGAALGHALTQGKLLMMEKALDSTANAYATRVKRSNTHLMAPQMAAEEGRHSLKLPIPEQLQATIIQGGRKEVLEDLPIASPEVARPDTISAQQSLDSAQRYFIQHKLGSGGFGDVYQVWDMELSRFAVVKIPNQSVANPAQQEMVQRRAKREMVIAANLDPRYTASVYDFIRLESGQEVPVMSFIPGHDLSKILQRLNEAEQNPLHDYERRLEAFAEICEAVESAHLRGIVHRDLKPENIRVGEDGHVRLMDWGIAVPFVDLNGKSEPHHVMIHSGGRITGHQGVSGTYGYIAPEFAKGQKIIEPAKLDIFALGVILWEMMTGHHPFMHYQTGKAGEAAKVPHYHPQTLGMVSSILGPVQKPSFAEVIPGEYPAFLKEIELITQKAFSLEPKDRYTTVRELRDAVLMARARSESAQIREIREEMVRVETQMHEAWDAFDVGKQLAPGQWQKMHDPILELQQLRASWRQTASDLIKYLEVTFKGNVPVPARKMIAETAWSLLTDEANGLSQIERQSLEVLIRRYDVATQRDPSTSMRDALEGRVFIDVLPVDIQTREEGHPAMTRIKVLRYHQDHDSRGLARGTYQLHPFTDHSLKSIQGKRALGEVSGLELAEGHYMIEVSHAGYHTTRIPLHVCLQDIRFFLQYKEPIRLRAELVAEAHIPKTMVIVQEGTGYTGVDFYQNSSPLEKYSRPLRRSHYQGFAITRYLITVSQYFEFIESMVAQINIDLSQKNYAEAGKALAELRHYIPRGQARIPEMQELIDKPKPENLARAFEGISYNWQIQVQGASKSLQFAAVSPASHRSAAGEPILADQPIHAIPYRAVEAYIRWRNEIERRDGKQKAAYRLPTKVELEIIARNSFDWSYPWGEVFDPHALNSRLIHADVNADSYPRGVGVHALGRDHYRDFSAYGVYDVLGSVRKITGSRAEPNTRYFSGASGRTAFGPYYLAAAETYAGENTVMEYNGGFYLVLPLPKPLIDD